MLFSRLDVIKSCKLDHVKKGTKTIISNVSKDCSSSEKIQLEKGKHNFSARSYIFKFEDFLI